MVKYELLAPVGDFTMLTTVLKAGADAVYLSLKDYGMRANAKNFNLSEIKKVKRFCDCFEVGKRIKIYLTINTIIFNEEVLSLEKVIKSIKGYVDAIICWDFAVIELCKKYRIPFFVSTQASVTNVSSAKFYKKMGAKRVVVARELNLKQIKEISKIVDVEAFCHGAMCVALSGRCFTSQFLFNRSANRGACIHPCRRSYIVKDKQEGFELEVENDKIFSAKDLCMLPFIEEMKKAGVTSFKIEGRARDPRYVDVVVRVYRKALDNKLKKEEIKELMIALETVYNKKFSTGFYFGRPTPKDFSDIEHSASSEKKVFVGKVIHYFDKIKVATIKVNSLFKAGEKASIIGKTTGVLNFKIDSIEKQKKEVKISKKGDEVGIVVPDLVRKNDELYVLRKVK
jgi:U32 family peptidase